MSVIRKRRFFRHLPVPNQLDQRKRAQADSTSQYDAIRAYLKELDITENVWIGLSKTADKPNFTWTDFRALNGEGHWQQPIPVGNDPLCVAMDPADDFLWKPLSCGGPEVAAFICELPVPSWALGARGCLLTELPSLTVLYNPEQSALELTSDCGLDGTKRIACKGNADREDILKQLTCAITHEDFDDKPTKSPVASTTQFDTSSDENSLNSKTTKPWIWTSNTIDIDYGMPTRHRRETEDTLSPVSTKSTTDLSTKASFSEKRLTTESVTTASSETEVTSINPDGDSTLDSSVSRQSDKSAELTTTQVVDLTTQDGNARPEEQAETFTSATATTDAKVADSAMEDTDEYPSAINQGQLFSIIENGTMFDIIELNETGTYDLKPGDITNTNEDKLKSLTSMPTETTKKDQSTSNSSDHYLYTTVIYNKEPPSGSTFVTNKSLKKTERQEKAFKKILDKESDPKKANYPSPKQLKNLKNSNPLEIQENFTLTKEVEMYPIVNDNSIILNRTDRKELPRIESETIEASVIDRVDFHKPELYNFTINNELDNDNHQHIEIKLQEAGRKNITQTLFITTKRSDKRQNKEEVETPASVVQDNIETLSTVNNKVEAQPVPKMIDPKLEDLNKNITGKNKDSEVFITTDHKTVEKTTVIKKEYLPKSLLGAIMHSTSSSATEEITTSEDTLESEPEAQPRPNRQRQLTRPQRRSFYPYFFSRVLG